MANILDPKQKFAQDFYRKYIRKNKKAGDPSDWQQFYNYLTAFEQQGNAMYPNAQLIASNYRNGLGQYDNAMQPLSSFMKWYVNSGQQTAEMDAYLQQLLLQQTMTLDQRAYDKNALTEQRQYDLPAAQLARLMSAGISRDAALQMLGSGGSGAGAGSALVGSGVGAGPDASLTGTPGDQAIQQEMLPWQKAGSVFDAIGTVCSLVGTGIDLAHAIPQVQMLNAQNVMTQAQKNAFLGVNAITQGMQSLALTDKAFSDAMSGWQNADDVIKYVSANPDSSFAKQVLQDGSYQSAFGTTYGREMFNRDWSQRLHSKSDGELFQQYLRQQTLQNAISEATVEKLGYEMENIQFDSICKNFESSKKLSEITLLDKQANYTDNLADLIDKQSLGQQITNDNLRMEYELNSSGFPMLKDMYLKQLTDDLAYWTTITDPDVQKTRIDTWLKQEENKNRAEYLEFMHLQAVGSFRQDHPSICKIADAFASLHIYDMLENTRKTVETGAKVFQAIRGK